MTAALLNRRPGAASPLPPVGTGAPATSRQGSRPALTVAYRWFARLLMAVALVAFAGLAVGPHLLGYRTMTMLSGSMAPGINPGDVVVDTPVDVSDVRVGMMISYHIPIDDHHVETHRVISVEHAPDGSVTVVTKGDANQAADPWKATLQGETAYQVRAVVPLIGKAITFLRTPGLSTVLVYAVPALLAGWLILTIWRPERPVGSPAGTAGDDAGAKAPEAAPEKAPSPPAARKAASATTARKPASRTARKAASATTARKPAPPAARKAASATTARKPASRTARKPASRTAEGSRK